MVLVRQFYDNSVSRTCLQSSCREQSVAMMLACGYICVCACVCVPTGTCCPWHFQCYILRNRCCRYFASDNTERLYFQGMSACKLMFCVRLSRTSQGLLLYSARQTVVSNTNMYIKPNTNKSFQAAYTDICRIIYAFYRSFFFASPLSGCILSTNIHC